MLSLVPNLNIVFFCASFGFVSFFVENSQRSPVSGARQGSESERCAQLSPGRLEELEI